MKETFRKNRIAHLIACAGEEAGEVAQVAGKIQRFGLFDSHPKVGNIPNIVLLNKEVNELIGVMLMLQAEGLPIKFCAKTVLEKVDRVMHFMEYAENAGMPPMGAGVKTETKAEAKRGQELLQVVEALFDDLYRLFGGPGAAEPTPAPEPEYINLAPGTPIQDGDEVLYEGKWFKLEPHPKYCSRVAAGSKVRRQVA